jgi:hypothetical protein
MFFQIVNFWTVSVKVCRIEGIVAIGRFVGGSLKKFWREKKKLKKNFREKLPEW